MGKVKIEGTEIEIAGDQISEEEFNFINDLKKEYTSKLNPSGVTEKDINPETGYYNLPEVSSKIRFAVSAAPNFESKVKTLQKFFPKVDQDEFDPTNFIVTDANGKKYILDDKSKTNIGDVIDEGKAITQMVTSTGGAIAGSAAGPVGTIAGSGGGLALGSEIYERIGQIAGTEIDRSPEEYATTRATEFAFGSVAQAATPLLLRGVKSVFKGKTDSEAYAKLGEKLGISSKEAEKVYKSYGSLEEKISKDIQLTMADRLKLFKKYDTPATLGQATENTLIDTLETTFSNVPFASQIMRNTAEKAQDQLGQVFTKNVISSLGVPRLATRAEAADVIKRGLTGKGGKVDIGDLEFGITNAVGSIQRFRNINNINYGAVKELLAKTPAANKKITLTKTLNFLAEKATAPGGLEKTFASINDPKIVKMFNSLVDDAGAKFNKKGMLTKEGVVSYEGIDAIRKTVGTKLSDPTLYEELPRAVYKKLYASIQDDIRTSLGKIQGASGTKILQAVDKANNYYNTKIKVIDKFIEPIAKKADIDNIVSQLITKSKAGDTTLKNLMKELKQERSAVLISSIMNKLGQVPSTGQLGALGKTNTFNTGQFIKNYDELSDAAKKTLFANPMFKGKNYGTLNQSLKDVQALATYIERQNPFKDLGQTATKGAAGTGLLIGGGAAATIGTGDPLFLLGIPIFGYGGAFTLKLMSNPGFMNWISQGVKIAGNKGFDGVLEHIGKLGTIAGMSDEDTAELTNQYLELIKKTSEASTDENKQQAAQQDLQNQQQLKTAAAAKPVSAPVTPVNTQVTDPMQFASLFPQDALGQAIAQRKVI
jgi:hypothetical protein